MGTRESREEERKQRESERIQRIFAAKTRQKAADVATYGEGSALLELQSSSKGDSRGGIWDISTDNYQQAENNQQRKNDSINDGNGIDSIGAESATGGGGGAVEFNGSVLICINGSPYYIDIPYDSDTGPYASSAGANFPINEP